MQPPDAFQRWKNNHPWLKLNENNKAICIICTEACEKQLVIVSDAQSIRSKAAWVSDGFCGWNNASTRIPNHSVSSFHTSCAEALHNYKTSNVVQKISTAQEKQMMQHRVALRKIFSTVKVLAQQGLPFRGGDNDENSNFIRILKARAEDVPQLESWLGRSGHKWLHHNTQNEILELMASSVISENLKEIKEAEFFSILLDETSDISRTEQVSVCIRVVSQDLVSKEYFLGFFSTSSTKAEVLFELVKSVFENYELSFKNIRGQCFDGAANVSGKISGLQSRIKEVESRALYVHCNAHNLNLVTQDAMEKVLSARNFIGVIKDIINFVRDSPKRLAQFKKIQSELSEDSNISALTAYCPTRCEFLC